MFLRNKLAILSFTLMSLMTIPTLAENDSSSVNSRIENANYDVQIKTPEGWSETKDFNHAIPETFRLNGLTFQGIQFKNGTENHGCVVFFAENDAEAVDEADDFSALENTLNQAQELAFPGSKISTVTFSKFSVDGNLGADFEKRLAKLELKGTIEANLIRKNGDPSKFTISGAVRADSSKGNFAIGTGQIVADGTMPYNGTTAVQIGTDYQIIILMWGTDEAAQMKDALRFLEAVTVTARAPVEPVVEPVIDIVVISEPVVVIVEEVVQVTPVVAEEAVPAPVTTDAVAANEEAVKATPVAVETAPATSEPVVVAEEPAPAAPVAVETAQVVPATTEEAVPAPIAAQTTQTAPVAAEPAAEQAAPAIPVAVENAQAAPAPSKPVVAAEEAAPAAPVATEAVVVAEEVVPSTPETPAA